MPWTTRFQSLTLRGWKPKIFAITNIERLVLVGRSVKNRARATQTKTAALIPTIMPTLDASPRLSGFIDEIRTLSVVSHTAATRSELSNVTLYLSSTVHTSLTTWTQKPLESPREFPEARKGLGPEALPNS